MKNLITGIWNKFNTTNALNTSVAGRMYYKQAPDEKQFPFIVYDIVSDVPEWNFTDTFENVIIQFDIFCIAGAVTAEIEDIYTNLKALYDDCSLTITGNTLLYMWRQNMISTLEETTTISGTETVEHFSVDYEVKMEAS